MREVSLVTRKSRRIKAGMNRRQTCYSPTDAEFSEIRFFTHYVSIFLHEPLVPVAVLSPLRFRNQCFVLRSSPLFDPTAS